MSRIHCTSGRRTFTGPFVDSSETPIMWPDGMWRGVGWVFAATALAVVAAGCGGGGSSDASGPASLAQAVHMTGAGQDSGAPVALGDERAAPQVGANGHFSGGSIEPTLISTTLVVERGGPAGVAALSGGGYVVATVAGVSFFDSTGTSVREVPLSVPPYRYIRAYGPPPYHEPVWAEAHPSISGATISSQGGSSYVAAWTGYARLEPRGDAIFPLYVAQGGGPLALVSSYGTGPDIAALVSGLVVASQSSSQDIQVHLIRDLYGRFIVQTIQVNTTTAGYQGSPAVTALADGGYVVVWMSGGGQDGSGYGIYGQRFDSTGNKAGAETRINTTTEGDQSAPDITALDDGGYLVTWISPDGGGTAIFGQRFDSAGNPVGAETRMPATTIRGPTMAALSDGRYVTISSAGSPSFGRVYASLYEDALVGTDGSNWLTADQRIHWLRGLAGNDRLYGNAGNDTLDGGEGDDFMAGGAGDDTYIVDSDKDKVLEHPGEGHDTVKSSLSHALGNQVEDLVLTGPDAIDGYGNKQDNVITGNAAANRLSGGMGNDTMEGGGGHDTIVFDTKPAADNVDLLKNFVAAEDTIELDARIFKALPSGTLSAAAFGTGGAATDSSQRIVFDPVTMALMYDPDGAGGEAAVQFATLEGLAGNLSAANFVVK